MEQDAVPALVRVMRMPHWPPPTLYLLTPAARLCSRQLGTGLAAAGAGLGAPPAGGELEGPAAAAAAGGCGLATAARGGAWLAQAEARTTGHTAAAKARWRGLGRSSAARRGF